MMSRLFFVLPCLLVACHGPEPKASADEQPNEGNRSGESSEPTKPTDPRTSYQLAAAISEASSTSWGEQARALESVRASWRGKRYRWQVGLNPVLCGRPDACVVFPFDHGRSSEPIVMGWLPRVKMTAEQHAATLESCDEKLCVLDLEATLTRFTLSPEDPTSLSFEDVHVHEVRAPLKNESWVRRASDPTLAQLRTQSSNR